MHVLYACVSCTFVMYVHIRILHNVCIYIRTYVHTISSLFSVTSMNFNGHCQLFVRMLFRNSLIVYPSSGKMRESRPAMLGPMNIS